jgi:peroxiredoxin
MTNVYELPKDLPVPVDDGGAAHLLGLQLPNIQLKATNGLLVNLSEIKGKLVLYCYPMTGRPNVALPDGWDQIPGARGCTPQSCSFRDHYQEIKALDAEVVGLSVQDSAYQREMAERLHLPFKILSDVKYEFQKALNLPTFQVAGMTLLKRVTLIFDGGCVRAVHYPIFPSDSDPDWVINQLRLLT